MSTRTWLLALAVAVAVAGALFSVPPHRARASEANTWVIAEARKPDGTSPLFSDTLPRFAADSVLVTDSVYVYGARAIYVTVQSSAPVRSGGTPGDSMAVPVIQARHAGGQWTGSGSNANFMMDATAQVTTTTLVNQTTRGAVFYLSEIAASGTPFPIVNDYARFRLRSTNARLYNAAAQATLESQGTITLRVFVLR